MSDTKVGTCSDAFSYGLDTQQLSSIISLNLHMIDRIHCAIENQRQIVFDLAQRVQSGSSSDPAVSQFVTDQSLELFAYLNRTLVVSLATPIADLMCF
jgi:hypothetical protein